MTPSTISLNALPPSRASALGLTYIELLLTLSLGALILLGITQVLQQSLETRSFSQRQRDLSADAEFAMQRMVAAVRAARILILPGMDERATTSRQENIRDETVPKTGNSTAVLGLSMDETIDRDGDGFPDADNDEDGRINEDWPSDINNDGGMGFRAIDDDNDGISLDVYPRDDDEDSPLWEQRDEDTLNAADDDKDGMVDEDVGADMNNDGAAGVTGVDDDGDGTIDEGSANDDDEDGKNDEDWLDTVAFSISGSTLVERTPVPWDANGDGLITGRDYLDNVIANGVTRFRVERVAGSGLSKPLVDITLTLARNTGESITLTTRVRLGGA